VSTPQSRARNFGLAGAAFGLGLIVGPALGGLLGALDLRLPFLVAASLAALNFTYGLLVLPESHTPDRQPLDRAALVPLRALKVLTTHPDLLTLGLVAFLANLATQFVTSTWILHGTARYGWTPATNGLTLTLAGILGVLVQVALLPRVLARLGAERTLVLALVCGVTGNLLYAFAAQAWMLLTVMPLAALLGLGAPPLQALIVGRSAPEQQGAVQGALGALNALGAIAGPLTATQLFAHLAFPRGGLALPGVAFLGTALILLAALAVVLRVTARTAARAQIT
ncbi:MFS transporter, partial [Deinococcus pimensis]|uniref:MFS transporter n=1 Tax=Deinococcus pimensis TaxID=309888 RepID=UPI0005EB7261